MQMTLEEGDNKQQNSDCHYEALTVCQVLCRQLDKYELIQSSQTSVM